MSTETDQLAGGWALTGFAWLAAGLWVVAVLPWLVAPLGVLLVADAIRSLRLSRGLASGRDDPPQRKTLARTMALHAAVTAVLGAGALVTRR